MWPENEKLTNGNRDKNNEIIEIIPLKVISIDVISTAIHFAFSDCTSEFLQRQQ